MLGQHLRRDTSSDNRIFVYEVTGLQQNEITSYQNTPIRNSHSQFIQVPFNRMNEEMQRILMAEGEIVNIFPIGSDTYREALKRSLEPTEPESAKSGD
ncbi:MAG: phycobilisome linker polypeptide [Cyanobacteria bacterium J06621_11]